MPGESECGDAWVVESLAEGALTAVVDGLGHGPPAAAAASRAVDTIRKSASAPLEAIVRGCHQALLGTRGAAISLALINTRGGFLEWLGVGNVEGLVVNLSVHAEQAERRDTLLGRGGVVGYQLPTLRSSSVPFEVGACLSLATDGIRHGFASELWAGQRSQKMADRILSKHGRQSDDALILVAQMRGGSDLDPAS